MLDRPQLAGAINAHLYLVDHQQNAALVEDRNINYNGPTGNLAIDDNGDVVSADFERFTFDASGRDVGDGTISVSSR